MRGRQRHGAEAVFMFCHFSSGRLGLTFVRVASLDVSGDADNGQGVDACKAKEQGEETIYLRESRMSWRIVTSCR